MKTILLLITLFAFLQSAFLPVNLVLVLIAARALVLDDRSNLYLAFFGGLILAFLMQVNLGYYPLLFILIVKLGTLTRTLPVSFNLFMILGAAAGLIGIGEILNMIFIQEQFNLQLLLIETLLVVPFYYLIRFWEDRFTASTHTKLRIK